MSGGRRPTSRPRRLPRRRSTARRRRLLARRRPRPSARQPPPGRPRRTRPAAPARRSPGGGATTTARRRPPTCRRADRPGERAAGPWSSRSAAPDPATTRVARPRSSKRIGRAIRLAAPSGDGGGAKVRQRGCTRRCASVGASRTRLAVLSGRVGRRPIGYALPMARSVPIAEWSAPRSSPTGLTSSLGQGIAELQGMSAVGARHAGGVRRGPRTAPLMLVGEQPGDEEDGRGHPVRRPCRAGLWSCVDDAGITADDVYADQRRQALQARGARRSGRLHKKPTTAEVDACHPWLEAELRAVATTVVVVLGATAARSLLGRNDRASPPTAANTFVVRRRADGGDLPPVGGAACRRTSSRDPSALVRRPAAGAPVELVTAALRVGCSGWCLQGLARNRLPGGAAASAGGSSTTSSCSTPSSSTRRSTAYPARPPSKAGRLRPAQASCSPSSSAPSARHRKKLRDAADLAAQPPRPGRTAR